MLLAIGFWLLAACAAYTYLGYPCCLALAGKVWKRPVRRTEANGRAVTVILVVYNEAMNVRQRLGELLELLTASGVEGEVIVVSDGSTDGTAEIARAYADARVQVLGLPTNVGKAMALTIGCAAARHDILVFADARQSWDRDALRLLLENFADPAIGAVSGDLVVESSPGVMAGVALYWRYEKWLRKAESRLHSTVGVTGAICAVRRELFRPIPPGTIVDDVYWPLQVVLQGFRVVHDRRARAYDRLPERVQDEYRRKLRTISGNFQLLTLLPRALLPWRNPIWWQFLSHKLLRLVAPWALLGMLVTSATLGGPLYGTALWGQLAFYLVGLAGLYRRVGARVRLAWAAGSFLVLNVAAWIAFWIWISGRTSRSWGQIGYPTRPAVGAGEVAFSLAKEGGRVRNGDASENGRAAPAAAGW